MKNKLKKIGKHLADNAPSYIFGAAILGITAFTLGKMENRSNAIYSDHLEKIRDQKEKHFEIARADAQQNTADYFATLKEIAKS